MTTPNAEDAQPCGAVASNDPWPCALDAGHPAQHCDVNGVAWSYTYKYGRPDVYEITWMTGHVENVLAHQVTWPGTASEIFGGQPAARRVQMMAEIDGHWTLTLSALEDDIRTMRRVTDGERITPDGAS